MGGTFSGSAGPNASIQGKAELKSFNGETFSVLVSVLPPPHPVYCLGSSMLHQGTASVMEDIVAAVSVFIRGSLDAGAKLCTQKLTVEGVARVKGHVEAGSVSVQGTLQAHSTVNVSGVFAGSGCFTVAETLRAATVDFLLDSRSQCRVDSMTTTGDIVFAKSRPGAGRLVARRVAAGGDVRLVATEAAVVRGRRVLIGPDCNIGVVEYLESCDVAPGSVVGEAKQVAAL